jgi:hypothetical protein
MNIVWRESTGAADSATREVRAYHIDMTDRARKLRVWTGNTIYEIEVANGARQEVLIRGGLHFQTPRLARVAARFSPCELWRGSVCVGLCLEIRVEGEALITSPVRRIQIVR